jgi:hypothetical protein
LLLYSSHLPLGVPNGLVIYHASSSDVLWWLCSEELDGEEDKKEINRIEK